MAKTARTLLNNNSQTLAFEVRLPDGANEEHLADFGDALEEFVGRFGYELHTPAPPSTGRAKRSKAKTPSSP